MTGLAVLLAVVFLYGLISRRLEGSVVTAPMTFVAAGMVLGPAALGLVNFDLENETVLLVAEFALALLLFTDATRVDLRALGSPPHLPARLLGVGMPLTIVLGAVAAALVLPGLSFWEAAIVAAVLAPTDAALGQAVVSDERVPATVRRSLNVEAGLNDGLSVPFLALFIALALAEEEALTGGRWILFALQQIGFGVLVGALVGVSGAWLVREAIRWGWISDTFERLALLALALLAYVLAGLAGGNGFIAAFAGGLCAGPFLRGIGERAVGFADAEGQLLNAAVFFTFGAVAIPLLLDEMDLSVALYAGLSLSVIRMLPVGIALLGTRLRGVSVLFMGWFGPRGLASIILGLVFLEEAASLSASVEISTVVAATVLLSVLLHGLTSSPLSMLYARSAATMSPAAPEQMSHPENTAAQEARR
jgi:NhaP-type Na+/H+ or K+/H+ antiporter